MKAPRRLLAITASSGKVGFVYFGGGELHDWGLSRKASRNVDEAFKQATDWLTFYKPGLLLTEHVDAGTRKGKHTRSLIEALRAAADDLSINCESVRRRSHHPNKYVEAASLATEFPQLEPWLPKPRKIWEPEPRNIAYFEALALAKEWLEQGEH